MRLVGGKRDVLFWPNMARHMIVALLACGTARAESWLATVEDTEAGKAAKAAWLEGNDTLARDELSKAIAATGVKA